jgi:hypothetical protein
MPYKNPEKQKEYLKKYKKEYLKNPKYIKNQTIRQWKRRGIITEDYNKLYEYYLSVEECENCGIELNSGYGTKKNLDHDHETGLYRNVLCFNCNILRR